MSKAKRQRLVSNIYGIFGIMCNDSVGKCRVDELLEYPNVFSTHIFVEMKKLCPPSIHALNTKDF